MLGKTISVIFLVAIGGLFGYTMWNVALGGVVSFPSFWGFILVEAVLGSFFLASLSLLFEIFLGPKEMVIRRRSVWAFVSGANFFEKNNQHVCFIFWARSFSFVSCVMVTTIVLTMALWFGSLLVDCVNFLFNPHSIAVDWAAVFYAAAVGAVIVVVGLAYMFVSALVLESVVRSGVLIRKVFAGLYFYVTGSALLGALMSFITRNDPQDHLSFVDSILVVLGVVAAVGVMLVLGFGIFCCARRMCQFLGQRVPLFAKVWEYVCPTRVFRYVE